MIPIDYAIIADIIAPGSKVLDLGCGEGDLLALLKDKNGCRGTGIEIDSKAVVRCLERGVSVSQGNINGDLGVYDDNRFDYVILNESLQQVLNIEEALDEALRVGKRVIVGVPNFCQWKARLQVFFLGEMPVTERLPYKWYNTPNLRFLSLQDFRIFCALKKIRIERTRYLANGQEVYFCTNLLADSGIFVLRRPDTIKT
ncbi:MAG: methionine biosynthesis protein MetW [Candidatus Omnitrophica bacterium]|nr:methionine biosynthesis protein MetW [Candidatus Omnitrophota bacterium]